MSVAALIMSNPCAANSLACSPLVAKMPTFFPAFLLAVAILLIASLSSGLTSPFRMGCPMLFPTNRSEGWSSVYGVAISEPTKVKRPDEEHVNAIHGSNLIHSIKRLLGLDLDHGDQCIVCLL